ncbi:MAG: DUF2934 domain-containing protein [Acidobacteria bacterium]|nr:DUF2934 domain-containing protein [Acidobacteriota bacterium]MCW5970643.1 DUF2934 domain-containing protein [Blastocatellales bacterium]
MSETSGGEKGMAQQLSAVDIQERISLRAYAIYLERGGDGGDPLDDWLAAESEVMAELSVEAPAAQKKPAARRRANSGTAKSKSKAAAPEAGAAKPARSSKRSKSAPKPAE